MTPYDWKDSEARHHWAWFVVSLLSVVGATLVISIVIADAVGADDQCSYTIAGGDTLSKIGTAHGTNWQTLAEMNRLENPDLIFPDDVIQVCVESRSLSGPVLVPQGALDWTAAVQATKPADATTADVRLLVALAGPEAAWCTATVNEGDADRGNGWGPSIGCVQVRTGVSDRILDAEPYRRRSWLEQSYENQAEAAWIIYQWQGREAWGPARPGRQLKLTETCENTQSRQACLTYWEIADIVL